MFDSVFFSYDICTPVCSILCFRSCIFSMIIWFQSIGSVCFVLILIVDNMLRAHI